MKKFIFVVFIFLLFTTIFVVRGYCSPKPIPEGKIIVYPNPWIPESGVSTTDDTNKKNTMKHGHLSSDGWIKFAGMQSNTGTIRIYDVTGALIKNFNWNATEEYDNFPVAKYTFSTKNSGTISYDTNQEWIDKFDNKYKIIHWDGKDNNYEYVKSGVYIWILTEDGGKSHHGKLVVIR